MAEEVKPKKKGLSRGAKRNIRRAVIALAVLGLGGAFVHSRMAAAKKAAAASMAVDTGKATIEDITQKISSTGTISAKDTYSITALVQSGTITEANFEVGDHVAKDQVLYRIDDKLAASEMKSAESALARAQKSLASATADLQDAQSKYGDGVYKATRAGYVTKVYVTDGEKISGGATLVDLTDETSMNVRIPFLSGEADLIQAGAPATLTLSDTQEQVEGTVVAVGAQERTLTGGRLVKDVTISLKNPGGLTSDTSVSATINGFRCVEEGKFEAHYTTNMAADLPGAADSVKILVHVGDYIQPGTPIFTMTPKSVKDMLETYSDKVDSAQSGVEGAQKGVDSAKETLDNYTIKSPIDGEVITKSYKVGDKLGGAGMSGTKSATTLATIYDMSAYTFKMAIDETDISKIQVGQRVEITADAIPGETFGGTVTNISLEGSSQGGVSTYPVTVTLDNTEKLLPGMNINAKIVIGSASGALCIPADALMRDNQVYVKDDSVTEAKGEVPAGFRAVTVETGLINGDKVQITSDNIKAGDEVYVQPKAPDTSDSMSMYMNGGQGAESEAGGSGGEANGDTAGGEAQGGDANGQN